MPCLLLLILLLTLPQLALCVSFFVVVVVLFCFVFLTENQAVVAGNIGPRALSGLVMSVFLDMECGVYYRVRVLMNNLTSFKVRVNNPSKREA